VILDVEGNMPIRFIIYGLLGWCGEIIWTAAKEKLSGQQRGWRIGPAYDTLSLRGLYDSAPYLHGGSAATLYDVLTTRNPSDQHGITSYLTEQELQDLVAFVQCCQLRHKRSWALVVSEARPRLDLQSRL
jgi:hypothetical protein